MSPAKKNNQPARIPSGRILLIAWCLIGAAWTCRGVLAGHRVKDYTFEDALQLVQSDTPCVKVYVPAGATGIGIVDSSGQSQDGGALVEPD